MKSIFGLVLLVSLFGCGKDSSSDSGNAPAPIPDSRVNPDDQGLNRSETKKAAVSVYLNNYLYDNYDNSKDKQFSVCFLDQRKATDTLIIAGLNSDTKKDFKRFRFLLGDQRIDNGKNEIKGGRGQLDVIRFDNNDSSNLENLYSDPGEVQWSWLNSYCSGTVERRDSIATGTIRCFDDFHEPSRSTKITFECDLTIIK